jgi:hypothetical protein
MMAEGASARMRNATWASKNAELADDRSCVKGNLLAAWGEFDCRQQGTRATTRSKILTAKDAKSQGNTGRFTTKHTQRTKEGSRRACNFQTLVYFVFCGYALYFFMASPAVQTIDSAMLSRKHASAKFRLTAISWMLASTSNARDQPGVLQ